MRYTLGLFLTYVFIVAFGQIASAQTPNAPQSILPNDNNASEPMDVVQPIAPIQPEDDTVKIATLISNWSVEPFMRDNGITTNECVMTTDYSNGFKVSFKGKNGQLSAVRLENPTKPLSGSLTIGMGKNSYGLQSRSKDGRIDGSLITVPAPAEKMKDIDSFRLRTGVEDYHFSTTGFAMAFENLLECQGYDNATSLAVVSDPLRKIAERTLPDLPDPIDVPKMPAQPIDIVTKDDLGVEEDLVNIDDIKPEPIMTAPQMTETQNWSAQKGEKLSEVLERWAIQGGVNPQIDLSFDPILEEDFNGLGALDIVVEKILQQTTGGNPPNAVLKKQDGNIKPIVIAEQRAMTPTIEPSASDDKYRWRALQGTDLRKVLKRWSVRENVDLIWNVDQRFLIKRTLKNTSDYKTAVAALIAQYTNQDVKPMASLNVDPTTGKKALVIELDKSS